MTTEAPRVVGVLLLALGAGACGWRAGLPAPAGAESVGIDVFPAARSILERNLEPQLNEAMTRAFVDLIDARLEHPRRADVVVKGELTLYLRRGGIRTPQNQLVETGVLVEASAWLVDRRSGAVLVPARMARVWSSYALDGVAAVQQEDLARERAFRNIAETLILDLFRPEEENPDRADEPLPGE